MTIGLLGEVGVGKTTLLTEQYQTCAMLAVVGTNQQDRVEHREHP